MGYCRVCNIWLSLYVTKGEGDQYIAAKRSSTNLPCREYSLLHLLLQQQQQPTTMLEPGASNRTDIHFGDRVLCLPAAGDSYHRVAAVLAMQPAPLLASPCFNGAVHAYARTGRTGCFAPPRRSADPPIDESSSSRSRSRVHAEKLRSEFAGAREDAGNVRSTATISRMVVG